MIYVTRWITEIPTFEIAARFMRRSIYFPPSSGGKPNGEIGEWLLTRSPTSTQQLSRAKQPNAGTAEVGGQRRTRKRLHLTATVRTRRDVRPSGTNRAMQKLVEQAGLESPPVMRKD